MTVRELINELLDSPMEENVQLYLEDNHVDEYGVDCGGYVFDIDGIVHQTLIRFTDWRKDEQYLTYCDVNENCEDCPRYGNDCDGRGEE